MMVEIARFRRRIMGKRSNRGLVFLLLGLSAAGYLGVILLIFRYWGDISPMAFIFLQTTIFCFLGPAILHGAIAGERERRSWDLLLAAPITKGQIVVGKFAGALGVLGLCALAFLPLTLLSAAGHRETTLEELFWAESISVTFGALVFAFTIFISSRVRRPFTALGVTLAALTIGLVLYPLLTSTIADPTGSTVGSLTFLHPIFALTMLPNAASAQESVLPNSMWGGPQVFVYSVLTVLFLIYAERTLTFAENDVKFMPRSRTHA